MSSHPCRRHGFKLQRSTSEKIARLVEDVLTVKRCPSLKCLMGLHTKRTDKTQSSRSNRRPAKTIFLPPPSSLALLDYLGVFSFYAIISLARVCKNVSCWHRLFSFQERALHSVRSSTWPLPFSAPQAPHTSQQPLFPTQLLTTHISHRTAEHQIFEQNFAVTQSME